MEQFDTIREDMRLQLLYIIGEGSYKDLQNDTENVSSISEAFQQALDSYTNIENNKLNAASLKETLSTFYSGARLDLQVQKAIRKIAQSEEVMSALDTDDHNIVYGVTSVLVNYYNAQTANDIVTAYTDNQVIGEQIDLMITALEQLSDKTIPLIAYSLMFIPSISTKLVNADFVVYALTEKENLKKKALVKSRRTCESYGSCLFLILKEEYDAYKSKYEEGYERV